MDAHKGQRGNPDAVRPRVREESVEHSGLALIWMDAVLLVPVIFGVMFLPLLLRLLVLSVVIGLTVTYALMYSYARLHPASGSAHFLAALHIAPGRRVEQ